MTTNRIQKICERINPTSVAFFDKVAIRIAKKLSNDWIACLRANSCSVSQKIGHHIVGSDKKFILTIVGPNDAALEFLARRISGFVNYAEIALDIDTPNEDDACELAQIFNYQFVQAWHGKKTTIHFHETTYTGPYRPGIRFVWYHDQPSKITGAVHTFHLEGRYQGTAAVRRIGINRISDLIEFDHSQYWLKNMKLYEFDIARLGRLHANRNEGSKRQTPRIDSCKGDFSYDVDAATGRALHRKYVARENDVLHSAQLLVDRYGRGPFLRRVDISTLLPP